jgi:hypothetical protein
MMISFMESGLNGYAKNRVNRFSVVFHHFLAGTVIALP